MKRMTHLSIAAMLATLVAPIPGQAKEALSYGPVPDWGQYKQLGEAALRAKLTDPERWTIEWPYGYVSGVWRHKGRYVGYMTCGRLRTETPGDGVAVVQFLTVIDNDMVKIADISSKDRNSLVNVWCHQLISRALPPVAQMEASAGRRIARLGFSLRPMAEGAYVVNVETDSLASKAGLKQGMVLNSANGIKLGGMGTATGVLLESDARTWRFETATGDAFTLEVAP